MMLPCLVEMLPLCWVFQQCLDELHKNGLLCIHLCISTLKDTIAVTDTIYKQKRVSAPSYQ